MSWGAILTLAAGAYAFKALGLIVFGRTGPAEADDPSLSPTSIAPRLIGLLPAALLAALVAVQTVGSGTELVLDARLPGVAAGTLAVWRGAPFWLVVVIAAAVTALVRLAAS